MSGADDIKPGMRMPGRLKHHYDQAFEAERVNEYPVIDSLEERYGYKMDRGLLERMARVLACPIKRSLPNWQHGRLVYALARHRLAQGPIGYMLDIGTAKGFSALCMAWAQADAGSEFPIRSFDVIDPASPAPRNSVMDGQVENLLGYSAPFMPQHGKANVYFNKIGDEGHQGFCAKPQHQIGFAFIDGSHTYEGVKSDIELVVPRQQPGDRILFDDYHLDGVCNAVFGCLHGYHVEEVTLIPGKRSYAIAKRVA